ncbi:hypothetical protein SAMD00019534_118890 [Acytostelium subglobosum LB1]|uniref:hypothetical protein n=1 Tax=Acytostelium subglobosum LB1 TaxID=1410327 RepID=UPI00064482D6|nr:hypothetical protein SAMD00019534_118890 [Acytostelium subglobosum LB1]GAM28713.1 hypothetical protein SAMD00019534_118890 [Acytostelium subglobosum LB1]|eukprot:XP_012748268.1 hypothetical protein SAMD00019534_118890 [Acytostelium subglobosum LB1]
MKKVIKRRVASSLLKFSPRSIVTTYGPRSNDPLPVQLQKYLISYLWSLLHYKEVKEDTRFLLSLALVSKRWLEWTADILGQHAEVTDDQLTDSAFLKHLAKRQPGVPVPNYSLRNFNKFVAHKYIPIKFANNKQRDTLRTLLFGRLEHIECDISNKPIPKNYFDQIVDGLIKTGCNLTTFTYRNMSESLAPTLNCLDLVSKSLTSLSINTTNLDSSSSTIASFIKSRAPTLRTLLISTFYQDAPQPHFYLDLFSTKYPELTTIHFGVVSHTDTTILSGLSSTNFPKLQDIGIYWTSMSVQEYSQEFIKFLSDPPFKRLNTTLSLTPLMVTQLAHNKTIEKWKFRVNRTYPDIQFNSAIRTLSLNFTSRFNEEIDQTAAANFVTMLLTNISQQCLQLRHLSIWGLLPVHFQSFINFLRSPLGSQLERIGFSSQRSMVAHIDYSVVIRELSMMTNLLKLEVNDVASGEHVDQIEAIMEQSSNIQKVNLYYSSQLTSPFVSLFF